MVLRVGQQGISFKTHSKYFVRRKPKKFIYDTRPNSVSIYSTLKPNSVAGKKRQIFWFVACLLSAVICVSQLQDRITHYFRNPIITGVSVTQAETAVFPPVILCPASLRRGFKYFLSTQVVKYCHDDEKCSREVNKNTSRIYDYPFEKMNLTAEKVWDVYTINNSLIMVGIACAGLVDKHACQSDRRLQVMINRFYSIFGRCIIYSLQEEVEFHGPSTYWKFEVGEHKISSERVENREQSDIMFFVHSSKTYLNHESYYASKSLVKFQHSDIHISSKHFDFLNMSSRICYDSETVLKCKYDCFNKQMENVLQCSLPFFNSSILEPCSTYAEVREAYHEANQVYLSVRVSDCKCQRICEDVTYTTIVDVVPKTNSTMKRNCATSFTFFFSDNNIEIVKESYLYTFSALLTDIAGNVGFFLGLSVLTFIEGLVAMFCYVHKKHLKKK